MPDTNGQDYVADGRYAAKGFSKELQCIQYLSLITIGIQQRYNLDGNVFLKAVDNQTKIIQGE